MTQAPPDQPGILLLDDGELEAVAAVLEAERIPYTRLRGGQIPDQVAPPRDLLIVTPRRLDRVRRGSPPDAAPGHPLRIVAVGEDSPAMRRRLRRNGLHLLVRLPAAAEIWRLLIRRSLYQGDERREDARVAVGSPVAVRRAGESPTPPETTTLIDLSNRGCRIQTDAPLAIGEKIRFSLPAIAIHPDEDSPLSLSGEVRRIVHHSDSKPSMAAIVFDPDLDQKTRTRLTALINRWASGPHSIVDVPGTQAPALPPCQFASLPDLTLDDETDPPVRGDGEVRVEIEARPPVSGVPREAPHGAPGEAKDAGTPDATGSDQRRRARGAFASTIAARSVGQDRSIVLIGRDLSARGMRIEGHPDLALGDRFRIALHGPNAGRPFLLDARVARDDGAGGFALLFESVDRDTARELEKLVACLPDVESLEDGEVSGLGAILSEILPT